MYDLHIRFIEYTNDDTGLFRWCLVPAGIPFDADSDDTTEIMFQGDGAFSSARDADIFALAEVSGEMHLQDTDIRVIA